MKSSFTSTDSTTNVAVLEDKKWVMLGSEDNDFDRSDTYGNNKTLVADALDTADSFEVWWLHLSSNTSRIETEELYHDEFSYMDEIENCMKSKTDSFKNPIDKIVNYTINVNDFKDMVNKANEILAEVD